MRMRNSEIAIVTINHIGMATTSPNKGTPVAWRLRRFLTAY
jgi:hypothetical protein